MIINLNNWNSFLLKIDLIALHICTVIRRDNTNPLSYIIWCMHDVCYIAIFLFLIPIVELVLLPITIYCYCLLYTMILLELFYKIMVYITGTISTILTQFIKRIYTNIINFKLNHNEEKNTFNVIICIIFTLFMTYMFRYTLIYKLLTPNCNVFLELYNYTFLEKLSFVLGWTLITFVSTFALNEIRGLNKYNDATNCFARFLFILLIVSCMFTLGPSLYVCVYTCFSNLMVKLIISFIENICIYLFNLQNELSNSFFENAFCKEDILYIYINDNILDIMSNFVFIGGNHSFNSNAGPSNWHGGNPTPPNNSTNLPIVPLDSDEDVKYIGFIPDHKKVNTKDSWLKDQRVIDHRNKIFLRSIPSFNSYYVNFNTDLDHTPEQFFNGDRYRVLKYVIFVNIPRIFFIPDKDIYSNTPNDLSKITTWSPKTHQGHYPLAYLKLMRHPDELKNENYSLLPVFYYGFNRRYYGVAAADFLRKNVNQALSWANIYELNSAGKLAISKGIFQELESLVGTYHKKYGVYPILQDNVIYILKTADNSEGAKLQLAFKKLNINLVESIEEGRISQNNIIFFIHTNGSEISYVNNCNFSGHLNSIDKNTVTTAYFSRKAESLFCTHKGTNVLKAVRERNDGFIFPVQP